MSQALLASVNRLAAQVAMIQAAVKEMELRLSALENQQRKTLGLPKKLGIQPVSELKMSYPYEK